MIRFLFVIILTFAVVGYFRGWFEFHSTNAGGESNLSVTVDKDAMKKDREILKEKVSESPDRLLKGK